MVQSGERSTVHVLAYCNVSSCCKIRILKSWLVLKQSPGVQGHKRIRIPYTAPWAKYAVMIIALKNQQSSENLAKGLQSL